MEPINSNEVKSKELMSKLVLYLFINAGVINVTWWFMFMLGTHITSKKADYFNDVIAPNISNLFTVFVVAGLLLLLIGVVILKIGSMLGKTISALAVGICIASPLFMAVYYFLLFLYGKADIPNLIVIPISLGISYFNYCRGRFIFKRLS